MKLVSHLNFGQRAKAELYCSFGLNDDGERLRRLFLERGSASVKKGYHLEFVFQSEKTALEAADTMWKAGLEPGFLERGGSFVVYLKGADKLCDAFALMGAAKAVLELNNMFAGRDVSKKINRALNASAANTEKIIESANAQIEAINKLKKDGGYNILDEKLKLTAEARLNFPEAGLSELAKILKVSKTTVASRLKKLIG